MPIRSAMTSKDPNPARYTAALFLITLGFFVFLCRNDGLWTYLLLHYHVEDLIFVDWYAVTAAVDAHRVGIPVFEISPFDYFDRPHVYSGLWLELGHLGIDRFDGIYVAAALVFLSILLISILLRPSTNQEFVFALVLALSSPFLMAYERANNDLVIFLLIAGLVGTIRLKRFGLPLGCALVAVATMLKYYPILAFVPLVLHYGWSLRTLAWTGGFAALALGQIFYAGELLGPLAETMPNPIYLFTVGGQSIFIDLGFPEHLAPWASRILFACITMGVCLYWIRKSGNEKPTPLSHKQTLFLLGAAIVIGCFVLRSGFIYRLIFCVFSIPLIYSFWQSPSALYRNAAKLWCGLFLILAWMETLTFNGLNIAMILGFGGLSELVFIFFYPVNYGLQWIFMSVYTLIACGIVIQSGWLRQLPLIGKRYRVR